MTDPAGGAPQAPIPPQPDVPPPAAAPAPPPAGGSWNAPPPAAAPGQFNPNFQQAAVEAGPAPGIAYADIVNRIIAAIIDGVIIGVIFWILAIIGGAISFGLGMGLIIGLVFGLVWAAATAVYFVYGWTKMRASFGQKFLNLETVNAADGATLTQNQAIRRWAFLWGPIAVGYAIPIVGFFILALGGLYQLYLLYTITQSPKRQGFHDVQAGTVVVKRLVA
jgi:uncharacterized RDD family membrane protein YckC